MINILLDIDVILDILAPRPAFFNLCSDLHPVLNFKTCISLRKCHIFN
jgi:hypothetical protein